MDTMLKAGVIRTGKMHKAYPQSPQISLFSSAFWFEVNQFVTFFARRVMQNLWAMFWAQETLPVG